MNRGHFKPGPDPRRNATSGPPPSAKRMAGDVVKSLRHSVPGYLTNLQSMAASGDAVAQGVIVMLVLIASSIRDGAGS